MNIPGLTAHRRSGSACAGTLILPRLCATCASNVLELQRGSAGAEESYKLPAVVTVSPTGSIEIVEVRPVAAHCRQPQPLLSLGGRWSTWITKVHQRSQGTLGDEVIRLCLPTRCAAIPVAVDVARRRGRIPPGTLPDTSSRFRSPGKTPGLRRVTLLATQDGKVA